MPDIADVLSGKSRWAIVQGDCIEVMQSLPADSVSLAFGSPPYISQRTYLENGVDLGIARGPEEWSAWMQTVFAACLRVCPGLTGMVVEGSTKDYSYDCSPFLLMADLCRAGVCLRKPPIYRRNGIPGSGGPDWLRNDYEPIICATRGGKLPWSENTACGHPPKWAPGGEMSNRLKDGQRVNQWGGRAGPRGMGNRSKNGEIEPGGRPSHRVVRVGSPRKPDGEREEQGYDPPAIANPGNIIDCGAAGGGRMGNRLCHENEAPFPLSLSEFFVLSFAPPDSVILDPFCGSGTTLDAAVKHGRRAIGIDLRASQVALTTRRLSGVTPSLFTTETP